MTQQDKPWTVLRLLDWTKGYFQQAGLESARLCAEVLLSHCLDCPRVQLYARFDYQPAAGQLSRFRELVRRAGEGEPVAYLVAHKEFYSLDIQLSPAVLIPRPETELLVDQAVAHLRSAGGGTGWDVCTGSGCVAVAVAHNAPGSVVLATDISADAVAVAAENAAALGLAERVTCAQADLLTLPEQWSDPGQFDVITANPPYVADGDEVAPSVRYEPPQALRAGPDGLKFIRPIIANAGAFLKPGGILCLEFGLGQADDVRDLILAAGGFAEPTVLKDHQAIERAAVTKKK